MIIVSGVTTYGNTRYFVLKCTKGEKWGYTFVLVAGKQVGLYIVRHSLRYLRHSGSVIYTSKLPSPSVSMPCDYRIL